MSSGTSQPKLFILESLVFEDVAYPRVLKSRRNISDSLDVGGRTTSKIQGNCSICSGIPSDLENIPYLLDDIDNKMNLFSPYRRHLERLWAK